MDSTLTTFAKNNYPNSKSDLFAMFIERCLDLVPKGGYTGLMTPNVWMYLSSHKSLRIEVVLPRLRNLVELPLSGFSGATVQICAFTLINADAAFLPADFVRLINVSGAEKEMASSTLEAIKSAACEYRFSVATDELKAIPDMPAAYWLSEKMRNSFRAGQPLRTIAEPRQGLATTDNSRFVRQWWEVSRLRTSLSCTSREQAATSGARWFPYNKGGEFRKWYGNQEHLVNWQFDGQEIKENIVRKYPYLNGNPNFVAKNTDHYFNPSISWSKISSGAPAFRAYPPGFIFDVAGTSIFAESEYGRLALLSYTNSRVAFEQLAAVAPTVNFEVGQIAGLPVIDNTSDAVVNRVENLIAQSKADWDQSEASWNFDCNPLVKISLEDSRSESAQSDY